MISTSPPINEIVGLLNDHSKVTLDTLRRKYPEYEDTLLKPGIIGGRTDKQTRLRAEVAVAGLKVAIPLCEREISNVRLKLNKESKLQFISQMASLVGGASIFGLLALDCPRPAKYAAAVLTLAGAILSLTAQYIGRSLNATANRLFEIYNALVECELEAKRIQQHIKPICR